MPRYVALLRGINLGPRNRIAMPALREALAEAGFGDVQTYLQSGNVVLGGGAKPAEVRAQVEHAIEHSFGLEIPVVVRSRADLARVVKANPLGDVATEPKRYQVTFLESKPPAELVRGLEAVAAAGERVVALGREIYAWHPAGVARSKLWEKLGGKSLGLTATSRNWTTVEALLELAGG